MSRYLSGVTTLEYAAEKCTGCGRCIEVCPHGVFTLENGKAVLKEKDACIECGACRKNCAFEAVTVRAGVGCATALINAVLKRNKNGGGCC